MHCLAQRACVESLKEMKTENETNIDSVPRYRQRINRVIRIVGVAFGCWIVFAAITVHSRIRTESMPRVSSDGVQLASISANVPPISLRWDPSTSFIARITDGSRTVTMINPRRIANIPILLLVSVALVIFNRRIGRIVVPEWLIEGNSLLGTDSRVALCSYPSRPMKRQNSKDSFV